MKYKITIDLKKALTGEGLKTRRKEMAMLMQEQTLDRIESGGDDEIKFAKLAFKRYDGSSDRPLFSTGSNLHSSITHGVDPDGPWVGSTFMGGPVLQFGTKGKSAPKVGRGKLPTIVPKNAKALFIPLSPRAAKSSKQKSGKGIIRQYRKASKNGFKMVDLVKGEDFILVSKVDLPPRPFLRVSRKNVEELAEVIATGKQP